ncbi:MAG: hypothetical protein JSW06_03220 [Thermoplasmatales archaeon]|nr:MAG: hypothetical protein JSW06_03220 [Thermoplasmatales archaeon]
MKFQISICLLLLIVAILIGCTQSLDSETQRFIGTWKSENNKFIFSENGGISIEYWTGTYEVQNRTLRIIYTTDDREIEEIYSYEFSENDTLLTLTDQTSGAIIEYTKQ